MRKYTTDISTLKKPVWQGLQMRLDAGVRATVISCPAVQTVPLSHCVAALLAAKVPAPQVWHYGCQHNCKISNG